MHTYKSKSGKASGVTAYDTGEDYITIKFQSGERYKYSYSSCGEDTVEAMKHLAVSGEGLSTYISQNGPPYESKLN